MPKYIFVTGGVLSGLGKGTVAASIARLLQFRGFTVSMVKCDPYLNVDAGTMNPIEHGENFVCEKVWTFQPAKGFAFKIAEVDQDFGTYERFTGENIHPSHNITSGQIYLSVILKERVGEYLGKTVQIIPHITDEIKRRILNVAQENKDIVIVEIGGTVGDIEGMPFLEAIRQLRTQLKQEDSFLVHVTYVPFVKTLGQLKTKPTQHSVQRLLEAGLHPDCIVARSEYPLSEKERSKLSMLTGVPYRAVISAPDVNIIYALPIIFEQQGLGNYLVEKLKLSERENYTRSLKKWEEMVRLYMDYSGTVKIALVGKYTSIGDAYISIKEALKHAGAALGVKVIIDIVNAEDYSLESLGEYNGILLTPGFGKRAVDGMIKAAIFALSRKIPFLGICFGGQLGAIAFARKIMGWKSANSTEIDPKTPYPIVDLLPWQKQTDMKGGTMRLGGLNVNIIRDTKLWLIYQRSTTVERFRHRYHIIDEYAKKMEREGFIINSRDEEGNIAGYEISWHPFFIGVQFHPEFKSRPWDPSPLYLAFVRESVKDMED